MSKQHLLLATLTLCLAAGANAGGGNNGGGSNGVHLNGGGSNGISVNGGSGNGSGENGTRADGTRLQQGTPAAQRVNGPTPPVTLLRLADGRVIKLD